MISDDFIDGTIKEIEEFLGRDFRTSTEGRKISSEL